MATPVLTKNQQGKSLSAKKKAVKGLKNVLTKSQENCWPLLKNDHGAELEKLLKQLLPKLKRGSAKIPWRKLRTIKKDERTATKLEAKTLCTSEYDTTIAKSVAFGINEATKLLEKDNASCILLDANIDPTLLVKHIVSMAHDKKVPVLIITFLKKVTLETIEHASAALTLKKDVENSSENYFYSLFKKVSTSLMEVSVPKTNTALFQDSIIKNCIEMDDKIEIQTRVENISNNYVSTDTYLYRISTKERVFKPPSSKEDNKKTNEKGDNFIALTSEKCDISDVKVTGRFFESKNTNTKKNNNKKVVNQSDDTLNQTDIKHVSYKPLKVKRLQGNPCRVKGKRPQKDKKK